MTKYGLAVLMLLIALVALSGFFIFRSSSTSVYEPITPNPQPVPEPVIGNNSNINENRAAGYVSGHVTIGPNCPVERVDEPCPTPTSAYTSREAVVYESNGTTVAERIHLDAQGNYNIAIGPGNYFIQIVPAGIGPGEKKPVTVKSFETTTVNFDVDTGIR